jgi:hypothetical protein
LNSKQRRKLERAIAAGVLAITTQSSPKSKKRKEPKKRPLLQKVHLGTGKLVSAILAVATLFGLYALKPKIVIEPYSSTNPANPFAQQFSVLNASVYAIHQVQPLCGFPSNSNSNMTDISTEIPDEAVETLDSGSKTTLTCSLFASGSPTKEMNIMPWVEYVTPFGFHRCTAVNFKGKPATGGTYLWTYHGSAPCSK